jgi:S1-C subfamily serine protease
MSLFSSGGSSTSPVSVNAQPAERAPSVAVVPARSDEYAREPEFNGAFAGNSPDAVSTDAVSSPEQADLAAATALTSNTARPSSTTASNAISKTSTGTASSSPASTDSSTASIATPERTEPFDNLADLIEAVEPSVVRINVYSSEGNGNGSGYVVDLEGTVITNRHVIEGASRVTGLFAGDETEYPITSFYSVDAKKDIAILKIDCPTDKLVPLPTATDAPRKGEDLVAFGAPLGLDFTASEGILSATRDAEDLEKMGLPDLAGTWMQHTVPISPGNSGGPLVNTKGQLIGMNTMHLTIGQNLNFAISAADVASALSAKSAAKPLQSNAVPVLAREEAPQSPPKFKVVDITGTDQATEYLAKLDRMQLIMLALGFDPTRRVTATVRSDLEEAIEKADIRTSSRSQARMFVGMRLRSAAGALGTQSVTITSFVHYLDLDGDKPTVYLIWNEEERAGTVAGQAFLQGVVPPRLRSGIKSHFRKFMGAVNKAKRAREAKS